MVFLKEEMDKPQTWQEVTYNLTPLQYPVAIVYKNLEQNLPINFLLSQYFFCYGMTCVVYVSFFNTVSYLLEIL